MQEFIYKNDEVHPFSGEQNFKFVLNDDLANLDKDPYTYPLGTSNIPTKEVIGKEIVFTEDNFDVTHESYTRYLRMAWEKDYGIVVKPDYIWFTILNNIAKFVIEHPEEFRSVFTTEPEEKIGISVKGDINHIEQIDVEALFQAVLGYIPTEITEDMIVPKFTTLTNKSKLAFITTFLETTSPYYFYGSYYCGYNKIKVLGEKSDYELMIQTLDKLQFLANVETVKNSKIFATQNLKDYFDICKNTIKDIIDNWENKEFWEKIYYITPDQYVGEIPNGWFLKFHKIYTKNDSNVGKISYNNMGIDFTLYTGILSSKIEDGYLVPDFSRVIALEKKDLEKFKSYQK